MATTIYPKPVVDAAISALGIPKILEDIDAVLADESLGYLNPLLELESVPPDQSTLPVVVPGSFVQTRKEGYRYSVAESAATDHDLITAGGVKLYVQFSEDWSLPAAAFGGDLTGTVDYKPTMTKVMTRAIALGQAIVQLPPGTLRMDTAYDTPGFFDDEDPTPLKNKIEIRGAGYHATVLKGANLGGDFFRFKNINDLKISNIVFDFAGARKTDPEAFVTAIVATTCNRVVVDDCRFIDSDPELSTFTIGTGDGVETQFFYQRTTFADRQLIPGSITITAGAQEITEDLRWYDGRLAGDGTGTIIYGDNNGAWRVLVEFDSPPANGAPVTLTAGVCDQRQSVLLLDCYDCVVRGINSQGGGRIKVGRPGQRCLIENNVMFGVNDNGITTVTKAMDVDTIDIIVRNNQIYHAATVGIFHGRDGVNSEIGQQRNERYTCTGNTVLGPRCAFRYIAPVNNKHTIIKDNRFLIHSIELDGVDYPYATNNSEGCVDIGLAKHLVIENNTIHSTDLAAINIFNADDESRDVRIENNTIGVELRPGLALRFGGDQSYRRYKVNGNTIFCTLAVSTTGTPSFTDCQFNRNTILSSSSNAFSGIFNFTNRPLAGVEVKENTLRMVGGSAQQQFVYLSTLTDQDVVVTDNDLSTSTRIGNSVNLVGGATLSGRSVIHPNNGYGQPRVTWAAAVPTAGFHTRGSVVWNTNPTTSNVGWMCTVNGTPGTWRAFAHFDGLGQRGLTVAAYASRPTGLGVNDVGATYYDTVLGPMYWSGTAWIDIQRRLRQPHCYVSNFGNIGARLLSGSPDSLAVYASIRTANTGTRFIASEWLTTGNQRSWAFGLAAGKVYLLMSGNGQSSPIYDARSTATVNDNLWHTIGFTYDGTTVTMFIDGASAAFDVIGGTVPATLFNTTAPFEIGGWGQASAVQGAFVGSMRDVRVESPVSTTVGRWPMQEESGTTAYNVMANANHATMAASLHASDGLLTTAWPNTKGYRKSGLVIIPGLDDGSSAADGNAFTVLPGDLL
jgi:hypothetical protein